MISKLIDKVKKYSPPWSKYYIIALWLEIMLGGFKIFKNYCVSFFTL
jgi:hypothetical protein